MKHKHMKLSAANHIFDILQAVGGARKDLYASFISDMTSDHMPSDWKFSL